MGQPFSAPNGDNGQDNDNPYLTTPPTPTNTPAAFVLVGDPVDPQSHCMPVERTHQRRQAMLSITCAHLLRSAKHTGLLWKSWKQPMAAEL